MRYSMISLSALALMSATPAFAQEATDPPEPITVSGSVTLASDYRFRGVSQTNREMAIQGGITVAHESGFYVGTWASNLAGWGTFGGANMELDLIGGYKTEIMDGIGLDVGLTWYMYPGGADVTDFAEPYVKLSGSLGPATVTTGVAYAPKQRALGNFSNTTFSRGQKDDNLYVFTDAAVALPNTPVTLKGHFGASNGNPGLGPNGTSVTPTGEYLDWSLGADVAVGPLVFNASYIDTDITRRGSAYLQPNFSDGQDGTGQIANATIVLSVSAAF